MSLRSLQSLKYTANSTLFNNFCLSSSINQICLWSFQESSNLIYFQELCLQHLQHLESQSSWETEFFPSSLREVIQWLHVSLKRHLTNSLSNVPKNQTPCYSSFGQVPRETEARVIDASLRLFALAVGKLNRLMATRVEKRPKWKRDKEDVDDASKKRGDLATTGGWFFPGAAYARCTLAARCFAAPNYTFHLPNAFREICSSSRRLRRYSFALADNTEPTDSPRRTPRRELPSSSSSSFLFCLSPPAIFFNAFHLFVPFFSPIVVSRFFLFFPFCARESSQKSAPSPPSRCFPFPPAPLCLPFVFASWFHFRFFPLSDRFRSLSAEESIVRGERLLSPWRKALWIIQFESG